MEIKVRQGEYKDLKAVHELVKELAIYEKEPQAVTASLEDYKRDFQEGIFECIVAEKGDEIVGMMLYYMAYSTWRGRMLYLEDFVVKEAYRRQGVGQLLYDYFLPICKQKGAILVKWQVLDWNEPAINFYKKNHAEIEKGWYNVKHYFYNFE